MVKRASLIALLLVATGAANRLRVPTPVPLSALRELKLVQHLHFLRRVGRRWVLQKPFLHFRDRNRSSVRGFVQRRLHVRGRWLARQLVRVELSGSEVQRL